MPLLPGTRLGAYEVVAKLGEGGMGEVYRATDTHLKRAVAIKVLPASVATDADRLARFQREAEVLAALNHPNIAGIYGLEKTADLTALVMELVEGDDLSQRIARGPIPLDEALPIAKQIAEALEAAHDAGIIHRDLKPANVKVRPDGTVKVLDFGLAKAIEPGASTGNALANSPTITSPAMTQMGMILGTAAYMSPEQAKGRVVDRRTDIFAFGCVLYEMLTGRRAFDGDDVTEVLGAVVRLEPDWSALPAACPPGIQRLLRLCLEKNVRNRRSSAADVRLDLDAVGHEPAAARVGSAKPARLPWIAAATLLLISSVALFLLFTRPSPSAPVIRFQVVQPAGVMPQIVAPALSPDGKHLAFFASVEGRPNELFLRSMESGDTQRLSGTERGLSPFWSPDSRFVGFFTSDSLKTVAASGGSVRTLCAAVQGATGTWNAGGTIVFSGLSDGLFRVPAEGGSPANLTTPDKARGEIVHVTPYFLPDGNRYLYAVRATKPEISGTYVGSLDGTPARQILTGSGKAQFARPDQLVFVRGDSLFAQSFDPNNLRLAGEPTRIVENIDRGGNRVTGSAGFSVDHTGLLVMATGRPVADGLDLRWYDRAGQPLAAVGLANYRGLELSPDGKNLASHRHDEATGGGDIWITDLERGTNRRFTFESADHASAPIWSPDGTSIAFTAWRNGRWGVYRKPANGAGADELLFESETPKIPMAWSPDGATLVFVDYNLKSQADLWLLPVTGDRTPTVYLQTPDIDSHPQISPDGRWIAYARRNSGVWVESFPVRGTTYQVHPGAGQPRWRRDGRELFISTNPGTGEIAAVSVETQGASLTFGPPKVLFVARWANLTHPLENLAAHHFSYAVSLDGQRFLIPRVPAHEGGDVPQPMTVIVNWKTLLGK